MLKHERMRLNVELWIDFRIQRLPAALGLLERPQVHSPPSHRLGHRQVRGGTLLILDKLDIIFKFNLCTQRAENVRTTVRTVGGLLSDGSSCNGGHFLAESQLLLIITDLTDCCNLKFGS